MGNIIDSVFYGVIYDYAPLLHGRVVDMLYFPIVQGYYPDWMPFWRGEPFIFFRPVFNIADSSLSIGVILILIFQTKFFAAERRPASDQNNIQHRKSPRLNSIHYCAPRIPSHAFKKKTQTPP